MQGVKITEDGDSLKFEHERAFGTCKWAKEKTEMTDQEKVAWAPQQAAAPGKMDAKTDASKEQHGQTGSMRIRRRRLPALLGQPFRAAAGLPPGAPLSKHYPRHQRKLFAAGFLICLLEWPLIAQTPPPQQQPATRSPTSIAPSVPYVPPAEATPPANPQQPVQQAPNPAPRAGQPIQARLSETDAFSMDSVSLVEMIDVIARRLKINYILDPRVQGAVSIHTYGAMPDVDLMPLLQTILRVNGDAIAQVGNLYHIAPISAVPNLPTQPLVNGDPKALPDDERMVLNLIFLKFTMAEEMGKLLEPFMGEGARHSSYAPANLLIIEDNGRSTKRTMDLIQMFDSDAFAGERVKLFDVSSTRPSDLVKQLETVFKTYAYSDKNSAVHFIPLDSINTLLTAAPSPDVFNRVKYWIDELDIAAPKPNSSGTQIWTYRMQYGRAEVVAAAIMALYTGNANAGGGSNLADDGLSPGMTYGAPAVSPPAGVTPFAPYTPPGVPFVIPNPFDNTIMVKGTGQDIDQIKELIKSLDVAPRGAH